MLGKLIARQFTDAENFRNAASEKCVVFYLVKAEISMGCFGFRDIEWQSLGEGGKGKGEGKDKLAAD